VHIADEDAEDEELWSLNSLNDVTFQSQRNLDIIFALFMDNFKVPLANTKKGEPFNRMVSSSSSS
jgi:hypothetical protein